MAMAVGWSNCRDQNRESGIIPIVIVATVATFAAIHEGYIIPTNLIKQTNKR